MSTRKKKASTTPTGEQDVRQIRAFYHGQPGDPVSSARFYWPAGTGPRESIAERFLAKRRPAGAESPVDTAARVEVLLRGDVPQDYTDPDLLIESYMSKLPLDEVAAFAQVTLSFPRATNLHYPWWQVCTWARDYWVRPSGVPVVVVQHAPFLAGSDAPVHVHCLVLMRTLSPFGWLGMQRQLAGDAGLAAAEASWAEWIAK